LAKFIDLMERRFGRLVVIEAAGTSVYGNKLWACRCDCGQVKNVGSNHLVGTHPARSCGCLQKERYAALGKKQFKDLTGKRFTRLTVIETAGKAKGYTLWKCVCDCKAVTKVMSGYLLSGKTRSCGCLKRDLAATNCRTNVEQRRRCIESCTTHGYSGTPEYACHNQINQRCSNPNTKGWNNYGGAGVRVCPEWNPKEGGSFEQFITDVGPKPEPKHLYSLGRILDMGDYAPGNAFWMSRAEQGLAQRNKRALKALGAA